MTLKVDHECPGTGVPVRDGRCPTCGALAPEGDRVTPNHLLRLKDAERIAQEAQHALTEWGPVLDALSALEDATANTDGTEGVRWKLRGVRAEADHAVQHLHRWATIELHGQDSLGI